MITVLGTTVLVACVTKDGGEKAKKGMQHHLEQSLTPHTFMASPIRGEGGRTGELQKGRDRKRKRKRGGDVFHKCSSIKSTDPNGIQ